MERGGCTYIMTNKNKTTLYIGVTSDPPKTLYEHQNNVYPQSFTAKYNLTYFIYYENFLSIEEAIAREKEIKKWRREKKDTLINHFNPKWDDLSEDIKDW